MEVVRLGSWLLGMLNVSVKIPPSDEDDVVKMSPCALVSRGSVVLMMVLTLLAAIGASGDDADDVACIPNLGTQVAPSCSLQKWATQTRHQVGPSCHSGGATTWGSLSSPT